MKKTAIVVFALLITLLVFDNALAQEPIVGEIRAYAGTVSIPQGWKLTNGANMQASLYPDLCDAIGSNYGAAPAGYCKLPDLRARNIIGSNGTTFVTGQTGGEQSHTLTINEMPSHTHTQNAHNHTVNGNVNAASGSAIRALAPAGSGSNNVPSESTTATNQNTGGGQSHNVLDPYLVMQYIIYVGGVDAPTPTPTATPTQTPTPNGTYTPMPTYTPWPTYTPMPTYTPVVSGSTYLPYLSAYTTTLSSGEILTVPAQVSFGQIIIGGVVISLLAVVVLKMVFGVMYRG